MGSANVSTISKPAALAVLTAVLAIPSWAQDQDKTAAPELAPRIAFISIPDRKLAVLDDGYILATFPIAVGARVSPSPTGEFQIVTRVTNPSYYHAGKVIPSGKDNPVGTRWLGLSQKGYGIHGTNAPRSIGHAASHGCFRLRNRDIEKLFALLRVGDTVVIRGERDETTVQVFGDGVEQTVATAASPAQAGGQ